MLTPWEWELFYASEYRIFFRSIKLCLGSVLARMWNYSKLIRSESCLAQRVLTISGWKFEDAIENETSILVSCVSFFYPSSCPHIRKIVALRSHVRSVRSPWWLVKERVRTRPRHALASVCMFVNACACALDVAVSAPWLSHAACGPQGDSSMAASACLSGGPIQLIPGATFGSHLLGGPRGGR